MFSRDEVLKLTIYFADPTFRDRVGRRIAARRAYLRLNQRQLGALASIDRDTMSRIEAGKQAPRLYNLYQIAGALDIDPLLLTAAPGEPWWPAGD